MTGRRGSVAIFAALLLMTIVGGTAGKAQESVLDSKHDVGTIADVSEGRLTVDGNAGRHILEPLEMCLWCERGTSVTVTFKSFTRALVKPGPDERKAKPVQTLVIRDGRFP